MRAERKKKESEMFKEVYDIFKKVVINIPLVDLVAQVPKYAKFLKDLCTTKRIFKHDGVDLKPTNLIASLADKRCVVPEGVLEDVLVKVKDLIFPVDFYVLDMDDARFRQKGHSSLILGRLFLKTAKDVIDVHADFRDSMISRSCDIVDLDDSISCSCSGIGSCDTFTGIDIADIDVFTNFIEILLSVIDAIDATNSSSLLDYELLAYIDHVPNIEVFDFDPDVTSDMSATDSTSFVNCGVLPNSFAITVPTNDPQVRKVYSSACESSVQVSSLTNIDLKPLIPSTEEAPSLELKPLPDSLKYAYLGKDETLPVIVANDIAIDKEIHLLEVLKDESY
ncbi:uncharacterized protein LOC114724962 [Neltuma alba]|uniref:uncharacterized protein LOC114724962 n=1 Tax=Neltuma alba TaxID=207710 RepID=UPI0010A5524A|nr:uncharacterized protein LOC114724962 [Prosopis alba]